jgi:hypothetical protein
MPSQPKLPEFLSELVDRFMGPDGGTRIATWMRSPDLCMTPVAMNAMKSTRTSFARVLARHMIRDRWQVVRREFTCDAEADGRAIYDISIGTHRLTYIARMFRWDGVEKVGRRSDGAYRDMCGAVFLGTPDTQRIEEEFATLETRDADTMRSRGDVTGWTPANRSVRFFEHVVESLAAGRQPDPAVIGSGAGYLLRNGGYLGSGRYGTLSIEGYPDGHPLKHPFFADLFGLLLVRQVSIDMVDAIAAARSPKAARLAPDIARYIGVGNSSGQGMCVALQRWPHWVATWMVVRELSLAYAKAQPAAPLVPRMLALLDRAIDYYQSVQVPNDELIVPHRVIVANLRSIRDCVANAPLAGSALPWGMLVARTTATVDPETQEQFNALLIECYPDFADAAAEYLPIGAARVRDLQPEMCVATLRGLLHDRYDWALRMNLGHSKARRHFWYHSADNGEQRRGDRGVDPGEEFESFIDHVGMIQRLAALLTVYNDDAPIAEIVADQPDIAYAISRVQYLADLPYAEIRGDLGAADFLPSHLIRFFLACLGMECGNPLSMRYVRGVFFQGMPLPHEIGAGTEDDWALPAQPATTQKGIAA